MSNGPVSTRALVLLDAVLINLGFIAAYIVRYEWQWFRDVAVENYVTLDFYLPIQFALAVLLLLAYKADGLYNMPRGSSWLDAMMVIFRGTLVGIAMMIVIVFLVRPYSYSRLVFGYAVITITVVLTLSRLVLEWVHAHQRRRGKGVDKVLVVGGGELGRQVMSNLMARPELGYQVVGFVCGPGDEPVDSLGRIKCMGSLRDIHSAMRDLAVKQVVVALPWSSSRDILNIYDQCRDLGVGFRMVPDFFQMSLSRVDVQQIGALPLLSLRPASISGTGLLFKRAIDVAVSTAALLLLSPLMGVVALAIKLDSPGPILLTQTRVGRGGRQFGFLKFRSMYVDAEKRLEELKSANEATGPLFKIRSDPRRTRVGRFIRRASIDELPQLLNVLWGDMSLVGPRPPLPHEVDNYADWHLKRLDASPGLTGLWQVSGRSDIPFDEMVLLDLFYIENWSPWLDFKILLRTVPAVLLARGAY